MLLGSQVDIGGEVITLGLTESSEESPDKMV